MVRPCDKEHALSCVNWVEVGLHGGSLQGFSMVMPAYVPVCSAKREPSNSAAWAEHGGSGFKFVLPPLLSVNTKMDLCACLCFILVCYVVSLLYVSSL